MATTRAKQQYFMQLIFAAAVMTVVCMPAHADEQLEDALRSCRALVDTEARVACYDELADRYSPVSEVPRAQSPEAGTPSYVELNDDVGSETLDRQDNEQNKEVITGTVVECRQDALNDTYFYFDNGQVWKQKTDSRMKFDDCNFDVTITRDFFGYKMQLVGETRRIRISRVR